LTSNLNRKLLKVTSVLIVAAIMSASAVRAEQATPLIQTKNGLLAGVRDQRLEIFRGIPFAEPPIGTLRWLAPQPVQSWKGTRSATQFAAACQQKVGLSLEGGGDPGRLSEDCLYLNVWRPTPASNENGSKLPVMVWLHGGALIFGAGSLKIYDGKHLAEQGVIVVTLNYRLGPLGFFSHPALDKLSPGGATNFGLLDQMAALRWVQQNIELFGGDANQVTIFGQSAGAQSVLALMASPLSQGLFSRAIAQSPYGIPSHNRKKANLTGIKVANALGLPGENASLAQLQNASAESIVALEGNDLSLAPGFIIGDSSLPHPILATFQAQQQAKVPLLIGSNSDEASVAVLMGIDPAALVKKLGAARILLRPLYPGVSNDLELGRQAVRDVGFTAFARRIAVLQSKSTPTWRYFYSYLPEQARLLKAGAAHGDEVTSVFGTGDTCECLANNLTDADRQMSRVMMSRWVAFAKVGIPSSGVSPSHPEWPADSRYRPLILEFGVDQTVRRNFMQERLNRFIGVLNLVGPSNAAN
jgi:para-nitrobenzyl esterase